MKTQSIRSLLLISLALLAGCDDRAAMAARDDGDPMQYGGVSGLNYTPYYIHTFNVKGHDDNGISGGGPNIQPARPDNMPSGGGGGQMLRFLPQEMAPRLEGNGAVDCQQEARRYCVGGLVQSRSGGAGVWQSNFWNVGTIFARRSSQDRHSGWQGRWT